MSSYRKTMGEVYNGMYLVEGNIDKIKDIVSKKSASKIDGVTVDMFTASAISQIYDKVNDANKKKMEKLPITKLAALAMKMMKNEYVPEEVDLDEAIPTSSAYALVIQQKDGSREIVAKGSKEKMKTAAKKYGGLKQGKVFISLTGKKVGDKIIGIGEELDLDEGTWAMPDSSKKLKGLMQVLKRPIPLGKGGDSAVSVIRDFIGDDELYDDLGDAGDKNPKGDARPIIMKAMKRLKITQKNAEVEMNEIDMNMVAFATFGFGAMVVLPGIIALDMLNSHTDGGVDRTLEKIINGLKSKLKKDKNYKPSSTEIDASKKLEKQIKKDEPSLYKKAMAKVKSISSKIKKEDLDEKLDKDDETIVKKVVDKLKKASQAHAGQSKDLQKAIDEDGHTDVASAQNNVKVAMSALTKMSGELAKLNPEDALPSWWTNKVAVAVDKIDGMADYLDTQVEEKDDFKPHMMYDPKTGKGHKADTMDDHLRMKKMGYTHDAPKKEEVKLGERLDPADVDDDATDDDIKSADKNIMMQLRKSVSLRGNFPVEFMDKKKIRVPAKVAQAVQSKYNSLRKPNDKEKFQSQVAKSYKDMLGAIKEAVSPAQQAAIAISKKERGEKPKKESKFNTINKQLKGEK